jgi:hypothetical protein
MSSPRASHHSPGPLTVDGLAAVRELPRPRELFSTARRGDAPPGGAPRDEARALPIDARLLETMATATEAMEYVERARGHLFTLHHLLGRADLLFAEVAAELRSQGRAGDAARIEREVVGRDVLEGRWSFEVLEEFEQEYYEPVRDAVRTVERRTTGRPHARDVRLRAAARRRSSAATERRSG